MICISRGMVAGTRLDAERAALFSDLPGSKTGPLRIPNDGFFLANAVQGIRFGDDASWTALMANNAVEIEDDLVEVAPAALPAVEAPAAAQARIQPPRSVKRPRCA